MQFIYPPLTEEELSSLHTYAESLIEKTGLEWQNTVHSSKKKTQHILLKIIRILCWILVILCSIPITLFFTHGYQCNLTFYIIIAVLCVLLLLVPFPKVEQRFQKIIWKKSAKKIATKLLAHPFEEERILEITNQTIKILPNQFNISDIATITTSECFIVLAITTKRGFIKTPLFLFLRTIPEIKNALKKHRPELFL